MSQKVNKTWGWKNSITREELEKAMEVYLKNGGKIKILTPEYASSSQVIGNQKWESYSSFDDFSETLN